MSWTAPRTWVATELVTAALMNTHLRDQFVALQGGLVGTGYTLVDLLGAAAPAVSAAGHATVIYDTATEVIEASVNGGGYAQLGTPIYQNPLVISQWRDVIRG